MHDSVSELSKSSWIPPYLIDGMVDCFKVDKSDNFFVVTNRDSCTDIRLKVLWHLVADLTTYELIIQI